MGPGVPFWRAWPILNGEKGEHLARFGRMPIGEKPFSWRTWENRLGPSCVVFEKDSMLLFFVLFISGSSFVDDPHQWSGGGTRIDSLPKGEVFWNIREKYGRILEFYFWKYAEIFVIQVGCFGYALMPSVKLEVLKMWSEISSWLWEISSLEYLIFSFVILFL